MLRASNHPPQNRTASTSVPAAQTRAAAQFHVVWPLPPASTGNPQAVASTLLQQLNAIAPERQLLNTIGANPRDPSQANNPTETGNIVNGNNTVSNLTFGVGLTGTVASPNSITGSATSTYQFSWETSATKPYMRYVDSPLRPRLHTWFGPLRMVNFVTNAVSDVCFHLSVLNDF